MKLVEAALAPWIMVAIWITAGWFAAEPLCRYAGTTLGRFDLALALAALIALARAVTELTDLAARKP